MAATVKDLHITATAFSAFALFFSFLLSILQAYYQIDACPGGFGVSMCILTFVTRYCERFPFILIGNRDEQLGRATHHLRYDMQTGLIWAVDQLAGGSWMGIEPRSGRFAILTNCRRAAAAPLLPRPFDTCDEEHEVCRKTVACTAGAALVSSSSAEVPTAAPAVSAAGAAATPTGEAVRQHSGEEDWRGAAPLSHIRRYTKAVPVRPELRPPSQPDAKTLLYAPPSSRGTIVKNFLLSGELPAETATDAGAGPPHSPLRAPFYAGYNLLTCVTLRTTATTADLPLVHYTSNRYGAEYDCPVAAGAVHVLQNSYLDNTAGEPVSARLRELFEAALHEVVLPLAEDAAASYSVTDIATRLADACLCDRSNFDIAEMMKEGGDELAKEVAGSSTAAAVKATVQSTNPLLGFSDAELQEFFGANSSDNNSSAAGSKAAPTVFTDGGAAVIEAHLQASILKTPVGGHGTRVQSMVLVERVPVTTRADGAAETYAEVIHFCQRDVSFEGEEQRCVGGPWIAFRIDADGSFARESE